MRTPWLLLAALLLLACGDRRITPGDGGAPDRPRPQRDSPPPPVERGRVPERGLPGDVCKAPGDCNMGSDFCNLDGKCTTTGAVGQCQPRPTGCATVLAPVCGCDGKTYGNECVAHTVGVSVAARGKCCKELDADYVALVKAAKECCVVCAIPNECTMVVNNQLACPCPTSVNAKAPQLVQLKALGQQWVVNGCSSGVACPPLPCLNVTGGGCQFAPGTSGLCSDVVGP